MTKQYNVTVNGTTYEVPSSPSAPAAAALLPPPALRLPLLP